MIHPDVQSVLFGEEEGEKSFSFVVEWIREPDFSPAAALQGKRERLEAVTRAYDSVKLPVLVQLLSEPGVTVKDLKGSPQAIVSASAHKWRELAREGGALESIADIRVLPNALFHTQD